MGNENDLRKQLDLGAAAAEPALSGRVSARGGCPLKVAQRQWVEKNSATFFDQAQWHECYGHPLADIFASPVGQSWHR